MNDFKKTINKLKKLKQVPLKETDLSEDPLSFNISNGIKKKEYTFYDKDIKIEIIKNALENDIHLSYLDKDMQNLLDKTLNALTNNLFEKILLRQPFKENDIDFSFNKIYTMAVYEYNVDPKSIN